VCLTCDATKGFLITQTNQCQTIASPVNNCIAYSGTIAAATCTACGGKNYLNATNTCTAITLANCNAGTFSANVFTCTECEANYVLSHNGRACVSPATYLSDQCNNSNAAEASSVTFANYSCNNCKKGAVPYDFQNQYACFSYAETAQLNAGTAFTATGTVSVGANTVKTTNCLKFSNTLGCVQCDPTSNTPYLKVVSGNSECVDVCPSGAIEKYQLNARYQISAFNVCLATNTVVGCAVYAPDLNDTPNFAPICIQCNTNSVAVEPSATAYSNANPSATAILPANSVVLNYIPSPNARYPKVECVAKADITQINGSNYTAVANTAPIANCDHYVEVTANSDNYACIKCKLGFTGLPTADGFLSDCNSTNACLATDVYNLTNEFANLFSCKSCTGANEVPVLVYKGTSATDATFVSFVKHNYTVVSPGGGAPAALENATGTERNISCKVRTASPVNVGNWGDTFTTPNYAGCGLIGVNSEANGDNASGNTGNFCVACSPGFKPTVGTPTFIQTDCQTIPHCAAGGNMFNACSRCDTGHVFAYVSSNVDYTQCLVVTDAAKLVNCYAAAPGTPNTNAGTVCSVCATGYSLNQDDICEAIAVTNCATGGFNTQKTNATASLDWALYVEGNAAGCNRCSAGYAAIEINVVKKVCLQNAYINNAVTGALELDYIPNCKNYNATNTAILKCSACEAEFVLGVSNTPANDRTNCYTRGAQLTNCALASNGTTCVECKDTTFSLYADGTCNAGNLTGCKTYNYNTDNNDNGTAAVCTSCNNGLYLDANGDCVAGNITNCIQYSSETVCDVCADNYLAIDNSANSIPDTCLPVPTALNCADPAITAQGSFTCNACINTNTQLAAPVPNTVSANACLSFSAIEGCETYNVGAIGSADFSCATCQDGRYLSNNKCTVYTPVAKCVEYDATSDACTECDDTSYLTNNGQTCTNNPTGIFKCGAYSNATTCTACVDGYFLASNTCSPVTGTVTGCRVFNSATNCQVCNPGLYLTNNTCVQGAASNCLTYASSTACATCAAGSFLTNGTAIVNGTSTATVNCVVATSRANCATLDTTTGTTCTVCNPNFYLNAGVCTAVTTNITQCAANATATTCARCNAGYTLNPEKTACVNTANVLAYDDANCTNSQQVADPVCSRCSAGRYFVNGACTGTCAVTGCLACSPTANSTCYICNTGYYQDSTGRCNAIQTNTEGSASIFGVLSAIVLVFAVMIK